MILILMPKPGKKTEIPVTIAEFEIKSVTPESSREAMVQWLLASPKVVNKWTAYTLKVIE